MSLSLNVKQHVRASAYLLFLAMFLTNFVEKASTQGVLEEWELMEHKKIFLNQTVIKVNDKITVVPNYGGSNVIFIEGDNGVLMVDAADGTTSASLIFDVYREQVSKKPIKGIVYTHFHTDHIGGSRMFVDRTQGEVKVFSHSSTADYMRRYNLASDIYPIRAGFQLGLVLPVSIQGNGIGIFNFSGNASYSPVIPTDTFDSRKSYSLEGIDFELIHTPGETGDQLTVWIPSMKAAFTGDNVYKAFPNLYAIRGTPSRNTEDWFKSLDLVKSLEPELLLMSHTQPIIGKDEIANVLTHYRDGIQFVYDQTIRFMNKGMTPDQIVEVVKLPPKLANFPYLREYYGQVSWSVRGIYDLFMGWFNGDPAKLNPLSSAKKAARWEEFFTLSLSDLVQPRSNIFEPFKMLAFNRVLASARKSLEASYESYATTGKHLLEELQWCLEITEMAAQWTSVNEEYLAQVKSLRYNALMGLARSTVNGNQRNYQITAALIYNGTIDLGSSALRRQAAVMYKDLGTVMNTVCMRLKAETCDDGVVTNLLVEFTDHPVWYRYVLRNCVFEFTSGPVAELPEHFDVKVNTASQVWRMIVASLMSASDALDTHQVVVTGSVAKYLEFFSYIEEIA